MLEALTGSELGATCGGKNDEPLPTSLPGRAVAAPASLGSYARPLGTAVSWPTPLPPPISTDR
jgi:hypothetical protein